MSNINLNAYDKLTTAFGYAQELKNHPNGGGHVVVHLQSGDELVCDYSTTDAPKSLTSFAFSRTDEEKRLNNVTRDVFKQAVIDIFGTSINDVPKKVRSAMNLDKFDGAGRPLTARRILAVNKAIDAELKAFAKKFGITGGGAPGIISVIAKNSGLIGIDDPAGEYKTRANRHATASIATHIASDAKTHMSTAQFDKDLRRGMSLSLGGKKIDSRNPAEVHNKIVRFITGRKNATFDNVDEQTRRKAYILMSMLHQGALACFMTGVQNAFDPEGKEAKFNASEMSAYGGHQSNGFAVTKDKAGNITIKGFVVHSGRLMLNMLSDPQNPVAKMSDADGVYSKTEGIIKLPAADLAKFADADWTKLDMTQILATDTNRDIPDRFTQAADMLPAEYKFTGTVEVSMKTCVNSLHDLSELG